MAINFIDELTKIVGSTGSIVIFILIIAIIWWMVTRNKEDEAEPGCDLHLKYI